MSTAPAAGFIPLAFDERLVEKMRQSATRFHALMRRRRTVRGPDHAGSIDAPGVRGLVGEILEGGREAFGTRRRKYGFQT